ncbi:MAG: hypothetical protein K2K01_03470, partial [Eubacterium sp.]|nr:hypothetical protein [Eubacterium sp.]
VLIMGKFNISNFDELFSKTKIVAESLNKKGSQAFDISRKRLEYLDAKAKLSKLYEKYGKIQFDAFVGEDINESDLEMLTAQIITYREKLNDLKAQLDEANDTSDLKREAEDLKKEVIIASQEAKEAIKKQVENAKSVIASKTSQSKPTEDAVEVVEVEPENIEIVEE